MSGSVEVVTSELHIAADRLRASGQRLQDGLSAVDLETSNLLGSGWKGEAATAFEKYWDQWHKGAGQVVRALQTMSEALDTAAQNYAAGDEQGGQAIGSTMQGGAGSGSGASPGGAASSGAGGETAGQSGAGGSSGSGASGSGSGGSGSSGGQGSLADQMNLGQVLQPLSQLGAIPAQMAGQLTAGLVQAGQIAAGAAQQAVQAGIELAQQSAAADAAERAEGEPEHSDGAAGGADAAGAAPAEPLPDEPGAADSTVRSL
ncbi:WXG100 family type VII secretion target [Mycobacterium sp. C31M]